MSLVQESWLWLSSVQIDSVNVEVSLVKLIKVGLVEFCNVQLCCKKPSLVNFCGGVDGFGQVWLRKKLLSPIVFGV